MRYLNKKGPGFGATLWLVLSANAVATAFVLFAVHPSVLMLGLGGLATMSFGLAWLFFDR